MANTSLKIGGNNWAVKEDNLLGYNVIQNKYVPIEIDTVRATTATRVNENGLIEVVPKNLASYSEQFDNAYWGKLASAISANATTAPNGMLTADKLIEDTSSSAHRFISLGIPTVSGTVYTGSIFVKAAGRDFVYVNLDNSGGSFVAGTVNLTNGVVTQTILGSISTIEFPNGWYKIIFSGTSTSTSNGFYQIRTCNSATYSNYTGDGTSGLYVWGAQLEANSTATDYFPTTDRLNIPRIDYSSGEASLLVEPQRTNLALYSEQFDNVYWTKLNTTVTANTTTAPDGTLTADSIISSGGVNSFLYKILSFTSGTVYNLSFYVKANSAQTIRIYGGGGGIGTSANLNVTTEWTRISYTFIPSSTGSFDVGIRSNSSNVNFDIFIWGAQLEAGSNATSYIPTVASTVTRNADVISKTGISGLIGQTEGTIFVDFNKKNNIESIISIDDASSNNRIFLESTGANNVKLRFISGGVTTVDNTSSILIDGKNKIAIGYANNDVVMYHNGVQIFLDNTATIPSTSVIRLGTNVTNLFQLNNGINSAQLYKTRLTNAELQALTTL